MDQKLFLLSSKATVECGINAPPGINVPLPWNILQRSVSWKTNPFYPTIETLIIGGCYFDKEMQSL